MNGLVRAVIGYRRPACTLIFLHIPKSAGSSLRRLLLDNISPRRQVRIIEPIAEVEKFREMPIEARARIDLVEGHMYYGIHELIPRPSAYLTMLRDPVERILSYYSFVRGWDRHHLHEQVRDSSIGECIRRGLTIELDNFMVRQLTSLKHIHTPFGGVTPAMLDEAKAHLESVSLLGLTEEFATSLDFFARALGWKRVKEPRENTTPGRIRIEDVSRADAALIRETNHLDQELYDHARELFRARIDSGVQTLVPRFEEAEVT